MTNEFINGVVIGVVGSIVSAPILYLLRFNLRHIANIFFLWMYPDISGEYRCYVYDIGVVTNKSKRSSRLKPALKDRIPKNNEALLAMLKERHSNDKLIIMMKLKQFANRVKGEMYSIAGDRIGPLEDISGRVTASRTLILNYEMVDGEHYNLGTYLLQLSNNSRFIKGTASGLCVNCGSATSRYIFLEKKRV